MLKFNLSQMKVEMYVEALKCSVQCRKSAMHLQTHYKSSISLQLHHLIIFLSPTGKQGKESEQEYTENNTFATYRHLSVVLLQLS